MGYKYRLVKENGWRFEMLPNNRNFAPIGCSDEYKTRQEALDGLEKLKAFLLEKTFGQLAYEKEEILSSNSKSYRGVFQFSVFGEKFYTTIYQESFEVKKGVERILKNYNAEYRSELNEVRF